MTPLFHVNFFNKNFAKILWIAVEFNAWADRQTDRQAGGQTGRRAGRQRDRQTDILQCRMRDTAILMELVVCKCFKVGIEGDCYALLNVDSLNKEFDKGAVKLSLCH